MTIAEIIKNKTHCIFVSPHLDDAAFSAGGLLTSLSGKTKLTVINVFTTSGNHSDSLSAKAYLRQCGYQSANRLYKARRAEDKKALESLEIDTINLNEVDALWRCKTDSSHLFENLLPEINRVYPTYRFHITKGKIAKEDSELVKRISKEISQLLPKDNYFVFCPLGVGNHVDHIIVRKSCEQAVSTEKLALWEDFPYSHFGESKYIGENNLVPLINTLGNLKEKTELCKIYNTQFSQVIPDAELLKKSEKFYIKCHFSKEKKNTSYSFGSYLDLDGKKVFVKRWSGTRNNQYRYFLTNEINLYKSFKNNSNARVSAPKFMGEYHSQNTTSLFLEYVDGSNLATENTRKRIEAIEKVLKYLSKNTNILSKKITNREAIYWILILPFISLKAIFLHPRYIGTILRAVAFTIKNGWAITKRNKRSLVHRDISDFNILINKNKTYLIDFQLACVADPAVDMAFLFLKYQDEVATLDALKNTETFISEYTKSQSRLALLVYLSIFCIHDISMSDGRHESSIMCLNKTIEQKL